MKYLYWAIAGLITGIITIAMQPSFINWTTKGEAAFRNSHLYYFQIGSLLVIALYVVLFIIFGIILSVVGKKN